MFTSNHSGKGIDYREIGNKCGVAALAGCKKVKTAGTDKQLFRLVPALGHGAGVLPLELVPLPGHGARVLPLELVPVPRHGAQISARAPTKGYVQTAGCQYPGTRRGTPAV